MDNQQNQQLGSQYGIRGFPTIKVSTLLTSIVSFCSLKHQTNIQLVSVVNVVLVNSE